jgi:hypothetical protein
VIVPCQNMDFKHHMSWSVFVLILVEFITFLFQLSFHNLLDLWSEVSDHSYSDANVFCCNLRMLLHMNICWTCWKVQKCTCSCKYHVFVHHNLFKDLYSKKDMNLVFSRFISRGEVLCYNRVKINSFILKYHENS